MSYKDYLALKLYNYLDDINANSFMDIALCLLNLLQKRTYKDINIIFNFYTHL